MKYPYQVQIFHGEHFTFGHKYFRNDKEQLALIKDWEKCVLRGDVRLWLEQNCEKSWQFGSDAVSTRGQYTFIRFESESDAVLFKTTWC